jgi:hypothetical protein
MSDIFDEVPPPRARSTDPETSHMAAASINAPPLDRRLYNVLLLLQDATTHELSAASGVPLVSVSPRMKPMEKLGLVRRTKDRRRGASGKASIVWEAIP